MIKKQIYKQLEFITLDIFINNSANVTLVVKFLGHTKIVKTLNTYSHMFSTALDYVVSVIDSLKDN